MSQDSYLGQPVTGFRGADIPLNLLNALGAIKSGQLGNQLVGMQNARADNAVRTLQAAQLRTALLTGDPGVRSALAAGDPETARVLGLRGGPIPAPTSQRIDPQTMQVGVPHDALFRAGVQPGMPTDTPALVETPESAQIQQRLADAEWQRTLTDLTKRGGLEGFQMQQLGPSGPTLGRPPVETHPVGTLGPGNTPIPAGYDPTTGREVRLTPGPLGRGGTVDPNRIDGAIEGLSRMITPGVVKSLPTRAPVDILPSFAGPGLVNRAQRTFVGKLKVPFTEDYTVGKGWLDDIANDTANPDYPLAQELKSGQGQVMNVIRGLGGAANASEKEEQRIIEAFLPTYGDSPGVQGSAGQKVRIGIEILQSLKRAILSRQIATRGQLRQALSAAIGGAPLAAKDATADGELILPPEAAAGSSTPTAARPTSAYDPAEVQDALRRLGLGE